MPELKKLFLAIVDWLRGKPAPNAAAVEVRPRRTLAWGNKVGAEFRDRVFAIAHGLSASPDSLMACIAFETGETFRADIRNAAGSGATGLIQFMPATARGLGTTTDALAKMTAIEQLEFVRLYFKPYAGRLNTLSDFYMAILWPAGIGKPESWVLWDKSSRPTIYRQNAGLDGDKDGRVTKGEAAARVQAMLEKGMRPEHLWVES